MTQVAAIEYANYNIRVNCIAPGIHRSEIEHDIPIPDVPHDLQLLEGIQDLINSSLGDIQMNRGGEAEELAGLAVLLASDASSFITGQIITQDGGRSAKH